MRPPHSPRQIQAQPDTKRIKNTPLHTGISDKTINNIEGYINNTAFTPDNVRSFSLAHQPLPQSTLFSVSLLKHHLDHSSTCFLPPNRWGTTPRPVVASVCGCTLCTPLCSLFNFSTCRILNASYFSRRIFPQVQVPPDLQDARTETGAPSRIGRRAGNGGLNSPSLILHDRSKLFSITIIALI